jgi:hypothetical protein
VELRDFIVTPILLIVVFGIAFLIRPYATDTVTRKYFMSALSLKIIGAIGVGLIYQFYYGGGDTFTYHTHGSRYLFEAFLDSPAKWVNLMLSNGEHSSGTFQYSNKIWFYSDPSSYFIVKLSAIFDLLTFSTYSATAVLFGALSFSGVWVLYRTFYSILPQRHLLFALCILFVPSVFFWGSGVLKDSVTLAAVGWATYCVYHLFIEYKFSTSKLIVLLVSCFVLFSVKLYILLCFLPATIIWVFLANLGKVKSPVLKWMLAPVTIAIAGYIGFVAVEQVGKGNQKYALENLAETARITAYDIGFYTGRSAGSQYSLGELDGTVSGMLLKAPQAINVSLFRPYLWEVSNVFMFISSLESLVILGLTVYILFKVRLQSLKLVLKPVVFFNLIFSLTFAFAVGISTYNFGTLVRYKIPLIPFYLSALILMEYYSKRERKVDVLEVTE